MTLLYEIREPRGFISRDGWYTVTHYHIRRSSRPAHLTNMNGLNFSKSVGVPTSRLERVRDYLRVHGPKTKREILRDVFNRDMDRGWSSTFFSLTVKAGYLTYTRKNGKVVWSIPT